MASSIAQVETLPLVPATSITGTSKRSPSRSLTRRTRASVTSISFGCSRSQRASQSVNVVGSAAAFASSGNGIGALALQHRDRARDDRAQFAAVDDGIDRAGLQQEFGALETLGQFLAHRVLDHAR